jgi:sucrose-6-phosphate hydrolase SacC (GH32 family)
LELRGIPLVYDARRETLTCLDHSVPLKPVNGKIGLRLLVDRTSIEVFGNAGALYLPLGVILDPENRSLELSARGGEARIESLEIYKLASIWS